MKQTIQNFRAAFLLATLCLIFTVNSLAQSTTNMVEMPIEQQLDGEFNMGKKLLNVENTLDVTAPVLHLDQLDFSSDVLKRRGGRQNNKLTRFGKALTFIGVPMICAGVSMMIATGETHYTCVNGECEGDLVGGIGGSLAVYGTVFTVPG